MCKIEWGHSLIPFPDTTDGSEIKELVPVNGR